MFLRSSPTIANIRNQPTDSKWPGWLSQIATLAACMPRDSSRLSRPTCCFKELPEPRCSNCRKPHWIGAASGHSSKFVDILDGKTGKHMAHTGTFGFFTESLWNCETTYLQWHDALSIYRYLISQAAWTVCHPSPFFSVGATSGGLAVCGTLSVAGRGITSLSADTHMKWNIKHPDLESWCRHLATICDN